MKGKIYWGRFGAAFLFLVGFGLLYFGKSPIVYNRTITKTIEVDTTVVSPVCDTAWLPAITDIDGRINWVLISIHNEPEAWVSQKGDQTNKWVHVGREDFFLIEKRDYDCFTCDDQKDSKGKLYSTRYDYISLTKRSDKVVNKLSLKESRKIKAAFDNRADYLRHVKAAELDSIQPQPFDYETVMNAGDWPSLEELLGPDLQLKERTYYVNDEGKNAVRLVYKNDKGKTLVRHVDEDDGMGSNYKHTETINGKVVD